MRTCRPPMRTCKTSMRGCEAPVRPCKTAVRSDKTAVRSGKTFVRSGKASVRNGKTSVRDGETSMGGGQIAAVLDESLEVQRENAKSLSKTDKCVQLGKSAPEALPKKLFYQSAKRTNDNSPAVHCWGKVPTGG
jgi:hypothetical protein